MRDEIAIWPICDVDDNASARVLEKVGKKREGTKALEHPPRPQRSTARFLLLRKDQVENSVGLPVVH